MGKLFLSFTLLLSISNITLAGISNLDKVPRNLTQLDKMIKIKKIEIDIHSQTLRHFKSMAEDANGTAFQTRAVVLAGGGVVAGAAMSSALYSAYSGVIYGVGVTTGMTIGGVLGEVAAVGNYLYSKVKSAVTVIDSSFATKEMKEGVKYSEVYQLLDEARNKIMDEYFDGSTSNMILDHIRLGGLSKKGTNLLFINEQKKANYLARELADLVELKAALPDTQHLF